MRLVVWVLVLAATACRPPGYGKGDDAAEPDAPPPGSDAGLDAPADVAAAQCDHGFRLDGHGTAATVYLTGDFVAWGGTPGTGAIPLVLGVDSAWTVTRAFGAGVYQYKFVIDEQQWIADPTNPDGIDDGFGGRNSLYTCTP